MSRWEDSVADSRDDMEATEDDDTSCRSEEARAAEILLHLQRSVKKFKDFLQLHNKI